MTLDLDDCEQLKNVIVAPLMKNLEDSLEAQTQQLEKAIGGVSDDVRELKAQHQLILLRVSKLESLKVQLFWYCGFIAAIAGALARGVWELLVYAFTKK